MYIYKLVDTFDSRLSCLRNKASLLTATLLCCLLANASLASMFYCEAHNTLCAKLFISKHITQTYNESNNSSQCYSKCSNKQTHRDFYVFFFLNKIWKLKISRFAKGNKRGAWSRGGSQWQRSFKHSPVSMDVFTHRTFFSSNINK